MVRVVLFDLDDTLFDHAGCARQALAAVQTCHVSLGAMTLDAIDQAHTRFLEQLHADVTLGRVPLEEARRERFRRLLATAGAAPDDDLAAHLAATYRETYLQVWRAIDGAAALLAAVKQRARVGVVSNSLLEEQQDKLRTCALEPFVDELVVSGEAGISKPDPAIFRMALERLDGTAQDAVMVGDSWRADIAGARAAGIRAVWFNPARLAAPEEPGAVRQLYAFEPVSHAMRIIFDAHRD